VLTSQARESEFRKQRLAACFDEPTQQRADGDAESEPWQELDSAGAATIMPVLDSRRIAAALFDPKARQIEVQALIAGYGRLLSLEGGVIATGIEVSAIEPRGTHWRLTGKDLNFTARIVVNAAGAWADTVAGLAGLPPIGLVPKRRTALTIAAPAGMDSAHWPMTGDLSESFYFRPEAGRLMLSPADETPMPPCDVQPDELDIAIAIDRLTRATTIEVVRVERKWAGLRSFVSDKTTVNGFDPLADGFFWLAGQGGYGIQTAEGMARCALSLIDSGELPADIGAAGLEAATLSPARFRG
jgi:D-arginine dehydrogenase